MGRIMEDKSQIDSVLRLDHKLLIYIYCILAVGIGIIHFILLRNRDHAQTTKLYVRLYILVTLLANITVNSSTILAQSRESIHVHIIIYVFLNNFADSLFLTPIVSTYSEISRKGQECIAINLMSSIYNIGTILSRFTVLIEENLTNKPIANSKLSSFRNASIFNTLYLITTLAYYGLFVKL